MFLHLYVSRLFCYSVHRGAVSQHALRRTVSASDPGGLSVPWAAPSGQKYPLGRPPSQAPPWADTLQTDTPNADIPWADTLLSRHPQADTLPWADTSLGQTPLLGRHLLGRHPVGRHASWAGTLLWADTPWDGYCSGRYASYWNAFLYLMKLGKLCSELQIVKHVSCYNT